MKATLCYTVLGPLHAASEHTFEAPTRSELVHLALVVLHTLHYSRHVLIAACLRFEEGVDALRTFQPSEWETKSAPELPPLGAEKPATSKAQADRMEWMRERFHNLALNDEQIKLARSGVLCELSTKVSTVQFRALVEAEAARAIRWLDQSGHSLSAAPCSVCGDLDGCHLARQGGAA